MMRKRVNSSILRVSGVTIRGVSCISTAIRPNSVCRPVLVTTPWPVPRVMKVPLKAMLRWSPGPRCSLPIASVCLLTGTDSPVSGASSA